MNIVGRSKRKDILLATISVFLSAGLVISGACTKDKTDAARHENSGRIIKAVTPREAYALIETRADDPDFVILDVRTAREFAGERIEGAVNLDYYSNAFRSDLGGLDKGKTYLIYCRSGNRSGKALGIMRDQGFEEVYDVSGGIKRWKAEGLPVIR